MVSGADVAEEGVQSMCTVCLADFMEGEQVTQLPCGGKHRYHHHCIGGWLTDHSTCPNCRGGLEL